jgi:hypothetical protein
MTWREGNTTLQFFELKKGENLKKNGKCDQARESQCRHGMPGIEL